MSKLDELKFPIGRYTDIAEYDHSTIVQHIHEMERFPFLLAKRTAKLSEEELTSTYRKGGWNVRQLVHHIADSHLNGYIRLKWTLDEQAPTIKPYNEKGWAKLSDSTDLPVDLSLNLLESLHARWTYVLRNLSEEQWMRTYEHPEHSGTRYLFQHPGLYAWHGTHHLEHIQLALKTRV